MAFFNLTAAWSTSWINYNWITQLFWYEARCCVQTRSETFLFALGNSMKKLNSDDGKCKWKNARHSNSEQTRPPGWMGKSLLKKRIHRSVKKNTIHWFDTRVGCRCLESCVQIRHCHGYRCYSFLGAAREHLTSIVSSQWSIILVELQGEDDALCVMYELINHPVTCHWIVNQSTWSKRIPWIRQKSWLVSTEFRMQLALSMNGLRNDPFEWWQRGRCQTHSAHASRLEIFVSVMEYFSPL